jgi:hypothetical protein
MSNLTQINLARTLTPSVKFICACPMVSSFQVSHPELCMHLSSPHVFSMLCLLYYSLCDNPDNSY